MNVIFHTVRGIFYLLSEYYVVKSHVWTLRCVIPVVCVTNVREERVVSQHNCIDWLHFPPSH